MIQRTGRASRRFRAWTCCPSFRSYGKGRHASPNNHERLNLAQIVNITHLVYLWSASRGHPTTWY